MATIVNTNRVVGVFTPAKTTLSASDVLVYDRTKDQELILYNTTASLVTVTIDGADGVSVDIPNTGGQTFNITAGLAVPVAANSFVIIRLPQITAYLQGVVAVTGGVGVVASVLQ